MAKEKTLAVRITGSVIGEKGELEKKVYRFPPEDAKRIVREGAGFFVNEQDAEESDPAEPAEQEQFFNY